MTWYTRFERGYCNSRHQLPPNNHSSEARLTRFGLTSLVDLEIVGERRKTATLSSLSSVEAVLPLESKSGVAARLGGVCTADE